MALMLSARKGNSVVPEYFLRAKQRYTARKMGEKIKDIIHTDKCLCEIQEQKEVPVWYTGPFLALPVLTETLTIVRRYAGLE
jgi:hypothetical protein